MKFICLFLPVIIFTVGFIVIIILGNQNNIQISRGIYKPNWKFNLYITGYYIILLVLTRIFSRWINVKKYQETWIRHSTHRYELDEEMFKFNICLGQDKAEFFLKSNFKDLWDSTVNKKDIDKYGFNANPWVWVIEFENR